MRQQEFVSNKNKKFNWIYIILFYENHNIRARNCKFDASLFPVIYVYSNKTQYCGL